MVNLNSLNPQQRLAVETLKGPVLILAGAGTGKTRVITHRVAYLVERGVKPDNILAVTFTNKAAREMQERITKLIGRPADRRERKKQDRPTICTFHSLCVRILRQHIHRLGYKPNFVIYSESDQVAAVKKVLSQFSARGEKTDPHAILGMLSRFKNGGTRAILAADESVLAMAQHIRSKYDSALRACNAVDFDDLILLTLRLFEEFPEALEACRGQYRFVMVDEYQDTNASQFRLVHFLASEHRNFCVVGDDDQSIYGWRGAEISNLLDMEKHFPEVKVIKLEQNYRSTTTILNAANALIKNNTRRRGKHLWSDQGAGRKIRVHAFPSEEEEAKTIVEEIEYARQIHRIPWMDQAILFRTNLQSRPLETALRQAGVRYHLIGGQSFFDRREIKDFLAYLKVFQNPGDDISLLRIANVPARGLSDATMEKLLAASHERGCSVHAAMKNPLVAMSFNSRIRESLDGLLRLIDEHSAILHSSAHLSLRQWAEGILTATAYLDDLRRSEKDPEVAENRARNVQEMAVSLDDPGLEGSPAERLQTYLEEMMLDNDRADDKEPTGDAVTLITMHSCKGLEFPHVFVAGLEEGLLPHSRSKVEGTLDEERRLFYVAITRARQTLTLSHCGGRKKYGQLTPCHPSSFLKELPADLLELADEQSRKPVTPDTGKNFFDSLRAALD